MSQWNCYKYFYIPTPQKWTTFGEDDRVDKYDRNYNYDIVFKSG